VGQVVPLYQDVINAAMSTFGRKMNICVQIADMAC